jgi:dipeptide ABC superfamily ATP binding cassette transporter membrane protein dppB
MLLLELITGVVIIEQIFSIPGIGRLLVQSVLMRDIPLIQGLIFYTSTFVVLLNFVIDILYSLLDPRIQVGEQ